MPTINGSSIAARDIRLFSISHKTLGGLARVDRKASFLNINRINKTSFLNSLFSFPEIVFVSSEKD